MYAASKNNRLLLLILSVAFFSCFSLLISSQNAYAASNVEMTSALNNELVTQASYPTAYIKMPYDDCQKFGQKKFQIEMWFTSGYKNNKYRLEIHKSSMSGELVADYGVHELTYYDYGIGTLGEYANLNVDAKNWKPGLYCVVYEPYFYSMYQWNEAPRGRSVAGWFTINGISKTKLKVKKGKSVKIPYSIHKGSKVTFKKVSGKKGIKVSKKGIIKVKKSLKPKTYKIKVSAFMDGVKVSTKKLKVTVK